MKKEIKEYARKILTDAGCDAYTYGGVDGETILRDLKEGYPNGMQFPYIDVANAIISISKVRPIKRATWHVIWNAEDCTDGFDCPSLGAAKCAAEDTMFNWLCDARDEWADMFNPTDEELDDFNYMIYNCDAGVYKYNPDTDEYEEYWFPDCEKLGWKELTREDIEAERIAFEAGILPKDP